MSGTIALPDGRRFNLMTNEGASQFFAAEPKFISLLLRDVLRGDSSEAECGSWYALIAAIGHNLRSDQLATVHEIEYRLLASFVKSRVTKISKSAQWRASGVITGSDDVILMGIVSTWIQQPIFVKSMLDLGTLEVIANLVARDGEGSPTIPSPRVAQAIILTTVGALMAEDSNRESHVTSLPKSMPMELERTGLLAQALRCLTVPVPIPGTSVEHFVRTILNSIERDTKLIKKFAPGTKSGDILEGLLNGTDGWTAHHANHALVVNRLEKLKKMATMTVQGSHVDTCRNCNKTELELEETNQRLLNCSICKHTYYCSRECQKADWKDHKKFCGNTRKVKPSFQNMATSFIKENYIAIMTRVKETCISEGIDKKDVVVTIDFYKEDDQNDSPAMEGQFCVASIRKFLAGDPASRPNWLNEHAPDNALRDQHKRMTSNHLLFSLRATDGTTSACRLDYVTPGTGFHQFSDEAMELFPQDTVEKKMKLMLKRGPANDAEKATYEAMLETMRGMGLG